MKDTLKSNVKNANNVGTSISKEYGIAAGTIQVVEGSGGGGGGDNGGLTGMPSGGAGSGPGLGPKP